MCLKILDILAQKEAVFHALGTFYHPNQLSFYGY